MYGKKKSLKANRLSCDFSSYPLSMSLDKYSGSSEPNIPYFQKRGDNIYWLCLF